MLLSSKSKIQYTLSVYNDSTTIITNQYICRKVVCISTLFLQKFVSLRNAPTKIRFIGLWWCYTDFRRRKSQSRDGQNAKNEQNRKNVRFFAKKACILRKSMYNEKRTSVRFGGFDMLVLQYTVDAVLAVLGALMLIKGKYGITRQAA